MLLITTPKIRNCYSWLSTSNKQCLKTRTGPVGRPGPGTGPSGGKNPFGNWPGKTRSTRDPVHQVKPGWDPVNLFFILTVIKRRRFWFSKIQNAEEWRVKKNEAKSVT